ncbi:hypothetical protein NZA98_03550, partial [Escherichia coli]|nr:hypothetical protein [Escherichia coli]
PRVPAPLRRAQAPVPGLVRAMWRPGLAPGSAPKPVAPGPPETERRQSSEESAEGKMRSRVQIHL